MYLPKILSLWLCLCFAALSIKTNAQTYPTYQLPPPHLLSPLFVGPLAGSGIYYGASPSSVDPNKPVIVYVHGFIDLNNLWFAPGNNMYKNTYNAHQNCAFVAMTRGQGMWQNGQILADMLDDITQHFGVREVVIVAHSNGGKASEVAMVRHNKRHKVNRVITLGTPFHGTELANLAEMPGFNWVVNLIGLGGGTSTSTTYYMGGYARPMLDWSFRNQPSKFINFGSWGYNNGVTVLRPVMTTSGALLNWMGSGASVGGNDGVTPYWSSSRPRGKVQWTTGQGNPISQIDHVDIALSSVMWNHIEPLFVSPLASLRRSVAPTSQANEVNQTIHSNLQFLSSGDDNMSFMVEEGIKGLAISILHATKNNPFELKKVLTNGQLADVKIDLNALVQTSALLEGYNSLIPLDNLEEGRYKLLSKAPFAALVHSPNGVELELDNRHQFKVKPQATLHVNINHAASYDLSKVALKAIITHKNDLEGKRTDQETVIIENFRVNQEGSYSLTLPKSLKKGVYNLLIQAEHPKFQKALVSGFVLQSQQSASNSLHSNVEAKQLTVFPNPAQNIIQVSFQNKKAAQLTIYDINGRVMHQQSLKDVGQQQLSINLDALKLGNGTYFLELQEGTQKTTQIFVKVP